jgi:hypothetical protein
MNSEKNSKISWPLLLGSLSGVHPVFPALYLGYSIIIQFIQIFYLHKLLFPNVIIYFYLIQCFVSGLAFGGFESVWTEGVTTWIANEGRVFVYFLPGLAILQSAKLGNYYSKPILLVSLFICIAIILRKVIGYQLFTSHHAAGAFSTVTTTYFICKLRHKYSVYSILGFMVSIIGLLGSNSRTSLIAIVIAVFILNFRQLNLFRTFKYILVITLSLLFAMHIFEEQTKRVQNLANPVIFSVVKKNLYLAITDEGVELSKAFDASNYADTSADANVAIRGYLFGQAIGHFIRSPLVGIGFGRFNDLGKEFVGERGLFYVANISDYPSPSNFTAHNTYLHILAETGLVGLLTIALLFRYFYVKISLLKNENRFFFEFGMLNLLVLLLMGVTQHSIGAPIFGFSNFVAICWAYTVVDRRKK